LINPQTFGIAILFLMVFLPPDRVRPPIQLLHSGSGTAVSGAALWSRTRISLLPFSTLPRLYFLAFDVCF